MNPYTPSDVIPPPARRRNRGLWFWALGIAVILGGSFLTYRAVATTAVTITGSVQITMPEDETFPSPCTGMGGYTDLAGGAQVIITDEAGATIAVGQLDPGVLIGTPPQGHACVLHFTLEAPGGHAFYGVEISHRGRLQYPRAALDRPLALTLGG